MPSTDKSDTIKTFKNLVETSSIKPDFTTEVLDGAAVVLKGSSKGTSLLHIYLTNIA